MGDTLFCERGALAKNGKKMLGKLLIYAIFGPFGGREIRELLRIVKVWMKQLIFFLYLFWDLIRMYIGDGSMSLFDFVDRLGSS